MSDAVRRDLAQPRATAALGIGFAAVALVAAAGGLFTDPASWAGVLGVLAVTALAAAWRPAAAAARIDPAALLREE